MVHVTESWEDQGHGGEYTRTISHLRGDIVSSYVPILPVTQSFHPRSEVRLPLLQA